MQRLLAAVFLAVLAVSAGCATGYTRDGREVRGLLWGDDGQFVAAAQGTGGLIGGALGGPSGATVGAAVAGTLAAALAGVAGLRRGERRGWDEADLDRARLERSPADRVLSDAARRAEAPAV